MPDDLLKTQIIHLKTQIFSNDLEEANLASDKLAKIGGDEIVEFLITLLESDDPRIRNRGALALVEIKDNKALEPLLAAIFKKENHNYNGTLVYALESWDCSKKLKEVFKILFYESYEAKISADAILTDQIFNFTRQDIFDIQKMWEDCIKFPEKCPGIEDEQTKLLMQDSVEAFIGYLKSDEQN